MTSRHLAPDGPGAVMRALRRMLIWLVGVAGITAMAASATGQTVENVLARLDNNNRDALVTYDLRSNTPDQYRIGLYYSLDNGGSFKPAPDDLSGNIGVGVTPGITRQIRWTEFSDTLRNFVGAQVIFRVVAQPDESEFVLQFDSSTTTATEGQGVAYMRLVCSLPFYGKVKYQVAGMTNVSIGTTPLDDVLPLSGEIQMTGTEGTIPVSIFDNYILENPKALTVDLVYDQSLGYSLGPVFRQMLILYDDDGFWNGVMKGDGESDGELPFRLAMANKDGVSSGALISNTQSPTAVSAFPGGTWPMNISWAGGVFSAQSSEIDVPGSSLFPQVSGMKRQLTLEADPQTSGVISPNKTIVGRFRDEMIGTGQRLSYLGNNTGGMFFLMREQPAFVPPPVPILPPGSSAGTAADNIADGVLKLKGDDAQ